MIFHIAWRNFYRQGIRSILNILISGFAIIAVIFMLSLLNGFQAQATRNLKKTDVAGGHYRAPGFDILTPSEWEDHTVKVSKKFLNPYPFRKVQTMKQHFRMA